MAIAAVVIAAIGAGYAIYQGESQKAEAKKIRAQNKRQQKGINPATQQIVNKSAFESSKWGMPGQAQLTAQMDESSAAAVRNIKEAGLSSAAMIGGFSAVDKNLKNQQRELGISAAQYKDRWTERHLRSLQGLANEQEAVWNYNVRDPYNEAAYAASALEYAGNINTNQGVNAALNTGQNALIMNQYGAFNNGGGGGNRSMSYDTSYRSPALSAQQNLQVPTTMENPRMLAPQEEAPFGSIESQYDLDLIRREEEAISGRMTDQEWSEYVNMFLRPR